jgi:hypothetical protein
MHQLVVPAATVCMQLFLPSSYIISQTRVLGAGDAVACTEDTPSHHIH